MTDILNSVLSAAVEGKVSYLDAFLIALIGIAIVFAVLIILMFVIWLMGVIVEKSPQIAEKHPEFFNKIKRLKEKIAGIGRKKELETKAEEAKAAASEFDVEPAIGSFGELKLVKTSERDAAMIMAIVADATQIPLNELRFKSIKQISEGEEK